MIKLRAPAKVNLFLRVFRKRPDGFHEIATLYERIALFDDIALEPHPSGIIVRTASPDVPRDGRNLAARAAALLREACGVAEGVVIHLRKRIPVGAGLGGGSSDAAAVLRGLNRLWKLHLSKRQLSRLGARLGSDVPFFLSDRRFALGFGRGEKVEAMEIPGVRFWHVLVKPEFAISTRAAYGNLRLASPVRRRPSLTVLRANARMLVRLLRKGHAEARRDVFFNSLELALNKKVAEIFKIINSLRQCGSRGSLLCGSGACVFGTFDSRERAMLAARQLLKSRNRWKVFVAPSY